MMADIPAAAADVSVLQQLLTTMQTHTPGTHAVRDMMFKHTDTKLY